MIGFEDWDLAFKKYIQSIKSILQKIIWKNNTCKIGIPTRYNLIYYLQLHTYMNIHTLYTYIPTHILCLMQTNKYLCKSTNEFSHIYINVYIYIQICILFFLFFTFSNSSYHPASVTKNNYHTFYFLHTYIAKDMEEEARSSYTFWVIVTVKLKQKHSTTDFMLHYIYYV